MSNLKRNGRLLVILAFLSTEPLQAHLRLCGTEQRHWERGRAALLATIPTDAAKHVSFGPSTSGAGLACTIVAVARLTSIQSPNFQRLSNVANSPEPVRIIVSDSRPICVLQLDTATGKLTSFSEINGYGDFYVNQDAMGITLVPPVPPIQPEVLYSCVEEVQMYVYFDHADPHRTIAHELAHCAARLAGRYFQHCGNDRFPDCEELDQLIRESYAEATRWGGEKLGILPNRRPVFPRSQTTKRW